jgi:hypothetical protein
MCRVADSHVNIDPESISRIGASTFNIFSGETPKRINFLGYESPTNVEQTASLAFADLLRSLVAE